MNWPAYPDLKDQVWAEFAANMKLPPSWTPELEKFLAGLNILLLREAGPCECGLPNSMTVTINDV